MNNYTTQLGKNKAFLQNIYKSKRALADYFNKLSVDNYKSQRKFITDIAYGLAKSGSLKLSEIARSLEEETKINSTITRLSRTLKSDLEFNLDNRNYVKVINNLMPHNKAYILVDDTDIAKPCSTKLEDLSRIIDASKGEKQYSNGYNVLEMVALSKNKQQPITIYSKIYSSISKGFISKNEIRDNAVKQIVEQYGSNRKLVFVFDRGFDDVKLITLISKLGHEYIIRAKSKRNYYSQNRKRTSAQIKASMKGKIAYEYKNIDLRLSHHGARLYSDGGIKVNLVIAHGFSKEIKNSMILLTNCEITGKADVIRTFNGYMSRWRIEESFKYNKQERGYEKMMVRNIKAMQTLINIMHMYNTLLVKMFDSSRDTGIIQSVLARSKSIKENSFFILYRLAKGMKIILEKSYCKINGLKLQKQFNLEYEQLSLQLECK